MEEDLRWYIGLLGDGTYRFIMPGTLEPAERYIGKHGGAVYSHAGYLIFAANKRWWDWLDSKYEEKYRGIPSPQRPPHIDVPNIECSFSAESLKWIEGHKEELKEKGEKFYDYIPRH